MAKAPPLRRRNSVEYLRTEVLKITQREVGEILGFKTSKTVYEMEKADDDRLTLSQLRALKAYAVENDIRWPANLVGKLLDMDPEEAPQVPVRKGGRPPGT